MNTFIIKKINNIKFDLTKLSNQSVINSTKQLLIQPNSY